MFGCDRAARIHASLRKRSCSVVLNSVASLLRTFTAMSLSRTVSRPLMIVPNPPAPCGFSSNLNRSVIWERLPDEIYGGEHAARVDHPLARFCGTEARERDGEDRGR